ncbi:lanthionine synthetase C family protein [Lipingzhangella sp. LS1_29]|uniref:Lanthionine synthetase C family protein n=1 Tax=Lipingzhangella rawalii TaxID=2055835 RepID=A0ABU2HD01_9ACTN|nr:lanthionine synthetase C family protein [Lipingzhangella rawalii]MDS1272434.1 lanthionine synthetase C family protein [Lipingzhangella rawalii]
MTTLPLPRLQDLAVGSLGLALAHVERGDFDAVRHALTHAVAGGVSSGSNASLFHGAPALEFVLNCAGADRSDVREAVDRVVVARLATARQRQKSGALASVAEFDLIEGLAGLGALLLTRGTPSPILEDVLAYLVSLAQPIHSVGQKLPGWWTSAGPSGTELDGGHGNNGIAHGISGPLAVLSLAVRHGVQVPGHHEAIALFASWLDTYGGDYWTTRKQLKASQPRTLTPSRPSWCYGRAGIARAQQLAALALDDPARRYAAEEALLQTLTDPAWLGRINDATLCHGWAGLLCVTRTVTNDSPTPDRFATLSADLHQRLIADIDDLPESGFLEGRLGAQLAAEGTDTTGWTRLLLIT